MKLRPYQERVMRELYDWFLKSQGGNPVVGACVGAGKSVLIAQICKNAVNEYPGTRILMVVASKELCDQNAKKLKAVWPEADLGIVSASLGKKQLGHTVTFATIGSVYKNAHLLGHIDLILVDECHNIGASNSGMYRTLIADVKAICPNVRVIGYTGTPFRGDGVWITQQKDPIFASIASKVEIGELVKAGYLAPLTVSPVLNKTSAERISVRNGDYVIAELDQLLNQKPVIEAACAELVELAKDRNKWLVFCVKIEHCQNVCQELQDRGIAAGFVHSQMGKQERDEVIGKFKRGEIRALCNVAILHTGFDDPEIDCLVLMRNTKSPVLYVQIAGRGMRVNGADIIESAQNGKENCLWLDFTDTTANLGPVDLIKGKNKKKPTEKVVDLAPTKYCENCSGVNPIAARECVHCLTPFPEVERKEHSTQASAAQIMSSEEDFIKPVVQESPITKVHYRVHKKQGKPDSMRVDYYNNVHLIASEFICPNHGLFQRNHASNWIQTRCGFVLSSTGEVNIEQLVEYGREGNFQEPGLIKYIREDGFNRIVKYEKRRHAAASNHDEVADFLS